MMTRPLELINALQKCRDWQLDFERRNWERSSDKQSSRATGKRQVLGVTSDQNLLSSLKLTLNITHFLASSFMRFESSQLHF
jgi:hypothetical protein